MSPEIGDWSTQKSTAGKHELGKRENHGDVKPFKPVEVPEAHEDEEMSDGDGQEPVGMGGSHQSTPEKDQKTNSHPISHNPDSEEEEQEPESDDEG